MRIKSRYQQGVVLVVALIMLLVMTAVGVTLMSGATLQERMAASNKQLSLARTNAEAALRQAELALDAMNITSTANTRPRDVIAANFDAQAGKYIAVVEPNYTTGFNPLTADLSESSSWTSGESGNSTAAITTVSGSLAPRYTIEYLGRLKHADVGSGIDISIEKVTQEDKIPFVFRITAIGYGANDNIYAVLQSIYSTGSN